MEPEILRRQLKGFSSLQRHFLYCIAFTVFAILYMAIYPLQLFSRLLQVTLPPAQVSVKGNLTHVHLKVKELNVCPGVLEGMTVGKWRARPITNSERNRMLAFLVGGDARHNFPPNFQRDDGKCGNVTHQLPSTKGNIFRALCHPFGMTPCCYDNVCRPMDELACYCKDCIDMRRGLFAEFSLWIPTNPQCHFKMFTSESSCRLLQGSAIYFVGDSSMRNLHIAMLMLMTGDMLQGPLRTDVSRETIGRCSGLYAFTGKTCHNKASHRMVGCYGFVEVVYKHYTRSRTRKIFKKAELRDLLKPRTYLILGSGSLEEFNATQVQHEFLNPLLNRLQKLNRKSPKMLWVDAHAPGLILMPEFYSETKQRRLKFNEEMGVFLKNRDIPILKTYNLTEGVSSFDGEHYGLGINVVQANLILNYIAELQGQEED